MLIVNVINVYVTF